MHFFAPGRIPCQRPTADIVSVLEFMITIGKALEIIKDNIYSLGRESVGLERAVGRVLAEDVAADMDMPPFDRSQMDGFAVKSADTLNAPVRLRIAGESVAGKGWHNELGFGEAVRIMTGAPVPTGADSVQMVELTDENEGSVTINKPTRPLQNIVRKAEEIKKSETILRTGELITDKMIATLASFGYSRVTVSKRPRVSILATGSEIVDIADTPSSDQIRNSNSWMLNSFSGTLADVTVLPIAGDDLDDLKQVISKAAGDSDCLIISGGVSVGDYDFTKPALRELGADIYFEKVSLKPGKPTVFARLGKTIVFGLPGNPVSVAVTFYFFVRKALLIMQGANETGLKSGFARLRHDIKATKGRDALLPVSLSTSKKGRLTVETLRFSGSSNFIRFARANGLVFVPMDKDLRKGRTARVFFL